MTTLSTQDSTKIDDTRISKVRPLITPALLEERLPASEQIQIILRINKEEVSDVVSTFQRHEYQVLYYYGEESYNNSLQDNLDHLLNYLNI